MDPRKFNMTSSSGLSSHFVDGHLIGNIESRTKNIGKLDPPAALIVAIYSTTSGVGMGPLTVRGTDAQGFLYDILLPVMNVPRLGRHLFSGGMVASKGVSTIISRDHT